MDSEAVSEAQKPNLSHSDQWCLPPASALDAIQQAHEAAIARAPEELRERLAQVIRRGWCAVRYAHRVGEG